MKKIVFLALVMLVTIQVNAQDFYDRADAFFKTYTQNGLVNYKALRANTGELDWLVNEIAKAGEDKTGSKSYLINAYNILVINQVVKHKALVISPMNISGFFDNKTAVLGGKKVSLNNIENDMIRKTYNDARVHFVLVCGALGCPVIADDAYRSAKLNSQLDAQTKKALNNSKFVYQKDGEQTVYLSQIFEWYKQDFGKNNKEVLNYINKFRNTPFNTSYKVKHYEYDWTLNSGSFVVKKKGSAVGADATTMMESEAAPADDEINLQTFTAGGLLGKGMFDFTLFNTLYTESKNNWQGKDVTGYRTTFVTHLLQVTYGITKSKRINVGIDVNFRSSGQNPTDSSFAEIGKAFAYSNDTFSRVGVTSVGVRLKVQPFKTVKDFSIQSTFTAPTIEHPEGNNGLLWADWNRFTWWNQVFYSTMLGSKFQLFTEVDLLFRFPINKAQIGMLDVPVSAFFSYFPTKKITVYVMTQHVERFAKSIPANDPVNMDWVIPANYTASGIGFKYQFLSNLNVELLYTNFWRAKNNGLGNTFNIGVKYLTR